jgi:hypothetical protein
MIQLQDHSPISLSPQVFRKMLKLPEPTLTFKGEDCRDFLKKHDNGLDLLPEFLENPMAIPEDITRLQVNLFKNPFREIAWLFTRVTGQENTASISRMILYILYFTVKEQAIFDWGKLISIEISSQLSQYKKDKKLFMSSYLVFAIAHCCQFPKLSICKKVNCEFDPVTFWYQALWRHKASLHFYEVFNDFVSFLKDCCLEKIPQEYLLRLVNSWIKRGLWSKWKITMSSGFSVLRKILPFFHAIYLTECLLQKLQGNITFGCTFFMKNEKINSYLCLGKLGILYSEI